MTEDTKAIIEELRRLASEVKELRFSMFPEQRPILSRVEIDDVLNQSNPTVEEWPGRILSKPSPRPGEITDPRPG